jgi:hypothetical protein
MTFFDPNHQIFRPSPIGGKLVLDHDKRNLSYFHYNIIFPIGVRVNAMVGRTIYFVGAGITGTITFTVMGDGILQYWGNYNGEKVNETLSFHKGKRLKNVKIGWTIR